MLYRNADWVYDALDYWTRGNSIRENSFSLLGIEGFRGYIFPFYLSLASVFGRMGFYIINALFLSFFVSTIFPYIVNNGKKSCLRNACAMILLCIFFCGLVVYPLSDLFALVVFSCALCCLQKYKESQKRRCRYILVGGVGFFAYLAYNTRTIYLFAGIAIIIYILIGIVLEKNCSIKKRIGNTVRDISVCGVGAMIAAFPQAIMNYSNLKVFSFKVPTNGLMLQQLFWGIQYQRYDTYVPAVADSLHGPQVYFEDRIGIQLLEKLGDEMNSSWFCYIKLFLENPIDCLGIYTRHLINFLFPCWPEIYVKNLHSSKWIMGLLGICLFFAAAVALIEKCYIDSANFKSFVLMMIPAALIVPGAVEYRFSVSIYIFVICQICYNIEWHKLWIVFKNKWQKYLILFIGMVLLCFCQWMNMLSSESVYPLLIQ